MHTGFANMIVGLILILVTVAVAEEPPKFHTQLSAEERRHYFGTELIEDVPAYEYTTPQPIDRRRKRSALTEDNLEYIIEAFGEMTHLVLEKNKDLIAPGCVVQHVGGNDTNKVYPCASQEVDCFYTGRSSNHSDSWVAASVCGGMHAMIGLPNETLVVQPIRDQHLSRVRRDTTLTEPYIVYHYQNKNQQFAKPDSYVETVPSPNKSRVRRSTQGRKFIETTIVVDPTAAEFHGAETEKIVKIILNVVAQRYLDPSLKMQVFFTLKRITILHQVPSDLTIEKDSGVTLDSFCHWQTEWNPSDDSSPNHADYVVLITKVDLEHHGVNSNTGLARKGMCGEKTKCSVVEDNGMGTGLIMAHETGHVLGMNHDSEGNNCDDGINLMSSGAPSGPNAFKWSTCSADYLKDFLSSSESSCLDDEPTGSEKVYGSSLKPGTIYSASHQCKLMLGNQAEVCEGQHANGYDVCGGIVCRAKHSSGVNNCIIYATPRMDGTDCGNRKWCIKGQCVDMGAGAPGPRNGGWSEWDTEFSECSRTCGGGVKVKRRYCNHPEPMYGGRACVGESTIAEMCNMEDCQTTQHDFLAEQCAATNDQTLQGRKYNWIPNTDNFGDDSCKVNCYVRSSSIYAKRGINIDGTECFLDSHAPFTRCVNGQCKEFGCDGHAGSGSSLRKYDECAVCNGRGDTCRKVSGTQQRGKPEAFSTFLTVPTGSTGILVTQINTYCHLSAVINNEQLFNGSFHQSGTYKKAGNVIKYQSKPERLEIIGPVRSPVQLQVYMKYGPPYVGIEPDVTYEYHVQTVHPSTTYMWKTKAGTCSKSCGTGQQIPTLTCESSTSGTVDDFHCDIYSKPKESPQHCNTQPCPPRWRVSRWGQCSKTCGGGVMQRTVECIEENGDVETVLPASRCHASSKPLVTSHCNQIDCPGTWSPGAWSTCSETCGRGVKTRHVTCRLHGLSVSDDKCLADHKPSTRDYCTVKPCRTDITGASCVDEKDNCFGTYGDDVCTGSYKNWARTHCMKSCGVCSVTSSECKDTVTNCNQYMDGFCTDASYGKWARNHCSKFCGFCQDTVVTTPQPIISADCLDKEDCPAYGRTVCVDYKGWAQKNCQRYCNFCVAPTTQATVVCEDTAYCEGFGESVCQITAFANEHCRKYCGLCQGCQDQDDDCAAYGSSVCTEYKSWAAKHCQGFCGLCNQSGRKRRSVEYDSEDEIVPPLMNVAPLAQLTPPDRGSPDSLADELLRLSENVHVVSDDDLISTEDDFIDDGNFVNEDEVIDDLVVGENEETVPLTVDENKKEDKVPSRPLCNTVRTASSGNINLIGKLSAGESCEQIIALDGDSKIALQIVDKNMDCGSGGDSLKIFDVINGEDVDMCDVTKTEITSRGNIVVVKVTAGAEGHGIEYTYKVVPQDRETPACSQYLDGVIGEIKPVRYPGGSKESHDVCDVYVTATPGTTVRLVFNQFNITKYGTDACMTVTDIEEGEEDKFCGELLPFIWESSGALVKLTYEQFSLDSGFDVTYKVQK